MTQPEWPKRWQTDSPAKAGQEILVIPADLGQDLYEALKSEAVGGASRGAIYKATEEVLARYEREVGQ